MGKNCRDCFYHNEEDLYLDEYGNNIKFKEGYDTEATPGGFFLKTAVLSFSTCRRRSPYFKGIFKDYLFTSCPYFRHY